eukprot:403343217
MLRLSTPQLISKALTVQDLPSNIYNFSFYHLKNLRNTIGNSQLNLEELIQHLFTCILIRQENAGNSQKRGKLLHSDPIVYLSEVAGHSNTHQSIIHLSYYIFDIIAAGFRLYAVENQLTMTQLNSLEKDFQALIHDQSITLRGKDAAQPSQLFCQLSKQHHSKDFHEKFPIQLENVLHFLYCCFPCENAESLESQTEDIRLWNKFQEHVVYCLDFFRLRSLKSLDTYSLDNWCCKLLEHYLDYAAAQLRFKMFLYIQEHGEPTAFEIQQSNSVLFSLSSIFMDMVHENLQNVEPDSFYCFGVFRTGYLIADLAISSQQQQQIVDFHIDVEDSKRNQRKQSDEVDKSKQPQLQFDAMTIYDLNRSLDDAS